MTTIMSVAVVVAAQAHMASPPSVTGRENFPRVDIGSRSTTPSIKINGRQTSQSIFTRRNRKPNSGGPSITGSETLLTKANIIIFKVTIFTIIFNLHF